MTARTPSARRAGGGKRPAPLLPERLLAKLWRAPEGRTLRAADGRRVRALYAGRPAPGHGPDFQDAVLILDGERRTGSVELHRKPSDWRAHGHDADPAYDGVALHVVARAEPGGPDLPVVELRARKRGEPREPELLAQAAREGSAGLRQMLVRSGLARFRERAEAAALRIAEAGPEQALQEAVFEALGYAENRAPFLQLAQAVPACELERLALDSPEGERATELERRLLEAAGFGGGSSAAFSEAPEAAGFCGGAGKAFGGATDAAGFGGDAGKAFGEAPEEAGFGGDAGEALGGAPRQPLVQSLGWKTAGVRPANHPRRRIIGAAALLARASEDGLAGACARSVADGPAALAALFTVADARGTLIGAGRAREIAVNAALPALAAAGASGAEGVYLRFPALPENALTKEARRLAGAAGTRLSACEQIGLIRLYRRGIAGR